MKTMEDLQIEGEVYTDPLHRIIYSSDASAYCEEPLGVMYPRNDQDLRKIIAFARRRGVTLIPRAAGTSLAGQVVGAGWVVDISKYMNAILEIQPEQRWVRVQPGVVLDELNLFCKDYGLFFAPETSTSNRCQIGGMIGNNSCGSHSLVYGSTRAHLLEAKVLLSDGSEVVFKPLTPAEVDRKQQEQTLEGAIYRGIIRLLSNKENQKEMIEHFPDRSLTRRNSGYALDQLLYTSYFDPTSTEPFNLCKILAGSEGTFALITEAKLNLEPLPPSHKGVVALHCHTLEESFRANLVALTHKPRAIELIDGKILELSKQNIAQSKNRFFIQGDPEAVLIIEFAEHSDDALHRQCEALIADLRSKSMGYAYPVICGGEIAKVWELRKAGLGLLSGMVGDAKPVSVVEDTAVAPERLPDYMADFRAMMDRYGLSCVYHAHISTGELHLRPILNLKSPEDRVLFRKVAQDCVLLVKKHRGSLSGEHGDGRLRGEFLPLLFGAEVYALMKEVKMLFDRKGVFNRGKIIDTPPMDHSLRYKACDEAFSTYFDYSSSGGYLRAIERCNGAGDCRKSAKFAGVMCPVFKALGDERYTTRARANILRDNFLNRKPQNYFHNPDVLALLDLCISCKGCKSECPSNVDMARYKAEYMQHYYEHRFVPLRTYLVAHIAQIYRICRVFPALYNGVVKNRSLAALIQRAVGFAPQRALPQLSKQSLRRWYRSHQEEMIHPKGALYLFVDEFTDTMDVEVGITFIRLLNRLGYQVLLPQHGDSGRAEISKGLLRQARRQARHNVELLYPIVTTDTPLVGIEPSALLSFRDEYPDLVGDDLKEAAVRLSKSVLLYDEFLVREIQKGNITSAQFREEVAHIHLHGHCHQKSLASVEASQVMLSLPKNYTVEIIPSGCCGMAGSFGYEKEHYALSMAIGETTLFPLVRKASNDLIAAPGVSCRKQIKEATGVEAYHPIELMYRVLK